VKWRVAAAVQHLPAHILLGSKVRVAKEVEARSRSSTVKQEVLHKKNAVSLQSEIAPRVIPDMRYYEHVKALASSVKLFVLIKLAVVGFLFVM
jgi:hypothetical protein